MAAWLLALLSFVAAVSMAVVAGRARDREVRMAECLLRALQLLNAYEPHAYDDDIAHLQRERGIAQSRREIGIAHVPRELGRKNRR